MWEQYAVEDVATPEGFQRDPALVLSFYNERRRQLLQVNPNKGHELLATLEKTYQVDIITQNVDNLHERAGSTHVLHLHGELTKVCSSFDPENPRYVRELWPTEYEIKIGDKAEDGSQLRPYIVWFGEAVPNISKAAELVSQADILVIIGTSMQVYPAAGLVHYAPAHTPIYLIDPHADEIPLSLPITFLKQGASEGVQTFIQLLNEKK